MELITRIDLSFISYLLRKHLTCGPVTPSLYVVTVFFLSNLIFPLIFSHIKKKSSNNCIVANNLFEKNEIALMVRASNHAAKDQFSCVA